MTPKQWRTIMYGDSINGQRRSTTPPTPKRNRVTGDELYAVLMTFSIPAAFAAGIVLGTYLSP